MLVKIAMAAPLGTALPVMIDGIISIPVGYRFGLLRLVRQASIVIAG
jgi:hypothetical protein